MHLICSNWPTTQNYAIVTFASCYIESHYRVASPEFNVDYLFEHDPNISKNVGLSGPVHELDKRSVWNHNESTAQL